MARVVLSEVVVEPQGQLLVHITGASATINIRGGGAATLYTSATGSTTISQPLTTTYGRVAVPGSPDAEIWIDEGRYDMAVVAGSRSWTQRVEAVSGSAESSSATVTRNSAGIVTSVVTGGTTTDQLVYDSSGRLTSFSEDGVTKTITRDNAGRISQVA